MKIFSFINPGQQDVIKKFLTLGGLSSRAPPPEARAPPVSPIRELTSVTDLKFVSDGGPAEPVWSTD
jgi:hypothetical protein